MGQKVEGESGWGEIGYRLEVFTTFGYGGVAQLSDEEVK